MGINMKQLSVFLENEIASLAKITSVLREHTINIKAISAFDSPDFGILRLIVDSPNEAVEILTKDGFIVKKTDVIAIELKNKPGHLDNVLHIIAKNSLNINYIYSFVYRENNAPLMVINFDNMEKATKILKANDIIIIE
jgi:hypothetical protein